MRYDDLVSEIRGQLSDEHADEVRSLVDAMLEARQLLVAYPESGPTEAIRILGHALGM